MTRLNDGLGICELFLDYCNVFISILGSRSDGTHLLQRIGEQIMWYKISPNLFQWRNKHINILDGLRVDKIKSTFSISVELFL